MPCINRVTNSELKLPFSDRKHFFYTESACGNAAEMDLCVRCSKKPSEHGLVSGPYVVKSHIFDSPWYHKSVKAYGTPNKDILEKAMEAQKKARSGKRVSVVKKGTAVIEPDTSAKVLPLDKMVESMDEPIQVDSVIRVILRPFMHNNVSYWRDSDREKIYKRLSNDKLDYIGRWDGEGLRRDIHDSDND